MAERGEAGPGRLAEVPALIKAIEEGLPTYDREAINAFTAGALDGRHVVVTSGPTHEPIDPVRYIANRSSGKQGHAIAAAALAAGARVTSICGPVNLPDPAGVETIKVETAAEMLVAAEQALPADIAVFCAAVADWRVTQQGTQKIKKQKGEPAPALELVPNPDILRTIAKQKKGRPELVIGFAAETEKVLEHASAKLKRKGCDWIVANDVSAETGVMGGDRNSVHLIRKDGHESWPELSKDEVATALVKEIAREFALAEKKRKETRP